MLATIVTSLIFSNKRILNQTFSESVRNHWIEWELRAMVLLSLLLQILLLLLGNRRKYIAQNWIRTTLWVAYNSAGWFSTVSLGILSKQLCVSKHGCSSNPHYVMMAFWAPFLLLHLGGPDTITAYALEDNELWTRDFPGLFVQFSVALFVCIRSWTSTSLNFMAIPIFVAGLVKYGERIWVLWYASSDHFRDSQLPRPDPGPNYAKFMGDYSSKKSRGYIITLGRVNAAPTVVDHPDRDPLGDNVTDSPYDAFILGKAYEFFKTYKPLFADLILSFQDREKSMSFFQNIPFEVAFRVIEVELGFMYDLLYTKAALIQSYYGSFLRFISFSCTCSVFVAFMIIDRNKYSGVDMAVTYVLLIGAILLELYSLLMLLISSDWTKIWLNESTIVLIKKTNKLLSYLVNLLERGALVPSNKRWSKSMAQYNLISFCLKVKPTKFSRIQKCLFIYKLLEKHRYEDGELVTPGLKELVFQLLREKSLSASDIKVLCALRGDQALRKLKCFDKLGWSVELEFDQSIILWHIATDLCYHTDKENSGCKNISKLLSDYMLYLLVMCPFMLPNGIGQIRYQDTCAEAIEFFQENECISDRVGACKMLLEVNTEVLPIEVKGDRSKSVLFDACRLAKSLRSLKTEGGQQWERDEKWKMISHVWVEMLSYAANQCRWNYHAKQLGRGGELLTHVWLLMAHLGITENFQISQGHVRAKLGLS